MLMSWYFRWNLECGHLLKRGAFRDGDPAVRKDGGWQRRVCEDEGRKIHGDFEYDYNLTNFIILSLPFDAYILLFMIEI